MQNIIHGINVTLQNLLGTVYFGVKENKLKVEIRPPDETTVNDYQVSLFCYKIMEHPFSKSQKPIRKNFDTIQFPPLVIDLYYLITVNTDPKQSEKISDVVGKVLRLFHDNAILSGEQIPEIRKDKVDEFVDEYKNVELKIRLNQMPLEEINHLWTLFSGIKYRTSLSYIVSPVIIPSEKQTASALVTSKALRYYG